MMNNILLLAIAVMVAIIITMQGQAFGQFGIDRLNKFNDVFFENNGIIKNLHPIQMKCITDRNQACIHVEETYNKHLKLLVSETQADRAEILPNTTIDKDADFNDKDVSFANSDILIYYISPIEIECSLNLRDPLILQSCIHFEETYNQHLKMFMSETEEDRLKIAY